MRLALAVACLGFMVGPAIAACSQGSLHETEASLLSETQVRMRRLGVEDVEFAKPVGSARMFIMLGSDVTFALYETGGLVKEARIALSAETEAERDRAVTLAAFWMARTSGKSEADMRQGLESALRRARPNNPSPFTAGAAAAMVNRMDPASFVIVVGELVCD